MFKLSSFAGCAFFAGAAINVVDVSRDSQWVVSGSSDGKARVHMGFADDAAYVLDDTDGQSISDVKFSKNSQKFATIANDTARLYAPSDGNVFQLKHVIKANLTISASAFSPTSCHLAVAESGSFFDNAIAIYDLCSADVPTLKSAIKEPPACDGCVQVGLNALAFSDDGQWLVSGCGIDNVRVYAWNATASSAELWFTLHGKEGFVPEDITALAFSPDSKLLVATYTDFSVQTWGYRDHSTESPGAWGWKQSVTFGGFAADVSPDGRLLATGSARIRHTPEDTDKLYVRALDASHVMGDVQILDDTDGTVVSVRFSGDSKRLVVAASGQVNVYSIDDSGKASLLSTWKEESSEAIV